MNTPLGVQGEAHQKRRDKQEAAFRKRYGADTASTTSGKVRALKLVRNAISGIERGKRTIRDVNALLVASGRNPSFAS